MIEYSDSDLFPESVDIPDDSDPPEAAVFNTPIEALLDRTRWLKNHAARLHRVLYGVGTVTGITPDPRCRFALVIQYPAGGGGGGGAGGSNTTHKGACGGGGGGGGAMQIDLVSIDPTKTYEATCGAGGAGGAGGTGGASPTSGADGSPGGANLFREEVTLTVKSKAYGGTGGAGGINVQDVSPYNAVFGIAPGGIPGGGGGFRAGGHYSGDTVRAFTEGPHSGGEGTGGLSAEFPRGGRNGPGGLSFGGGLAGSKGTDESSTGDTWIPGGPGGGGGGGSYISATADGRTGGAGGNGGNTATGTPVSSEHGANGAAADSSRGGGGGGGGGGGKLGDGGDGGAGGDGRMVVLYIYEESGM